MVNKRKKDDEEELIDLKQEYGIDETELKDLISFNEKGNRHVLRHRLKKVDEGIGKIDDGLLDIIVTVDQIIDDYEEGKILNNDNGKAIEELFVLIDFLTELQTSFNRLKTKRESI